MDELKGFTFEIQREVHQYRTVKIWAVDSDDALERFYNDDCVTIDEYDKVRNVDILSMQEDS